MILDGRARAAAGPIISWQTVTNRTPNDYAEALHAGRSVIERVASSVRPEEATPARKLLQVMDETRRSRSHKRLLRDSP
jgi:hypothetical protein